MTETIIVASRMPMAIRMASDQHGTTVIHGSNHTDCLDGAGITRGVNADAFDAWMAANAKSEAVLQKLITRVDESAVTHAPPEARHAAPPAVTERSDVADDEAAKASAISGETAGI